jgi:hypothetical protein
MLIASRSKQAVSCKIALRSLPDMFVFPNRSANAFYRIAACLLPESLTKGM